MEMALNVDMNRPGRRFWIPYEWPKHGTFYVRTVVVVPRTAFGWTPTQDLVDYLNLVSV
jgi:hypothetical protein